MSNSDFPTTYQPPKTSRLDYFYDRPGTTPGELHLPDDALPADLVPIDYDRHRSTRVAITNSATIKEYLTTYTVSWTDVLGLKNMATWNTLIPIFNLYQMLLEDIVSVPQRPQVEGY